MIVTIETSQVTISDPTNDTVENCTHIFTRGEFSLLVNMNIDSIRSASYEEENGIYMVKDDSGLNSFDKPEAHTLLNSIKYFRVQLIMATERAIMEPIGNELYQGAWRPTFSALVDKKSMEYLAQYQSDLMKLTGITDPAEMSSWTKQEVEARAFLVDPTVPTPLIDGLLLGRNLMETKEDLVTKIIYNADLYATNYAVLLGTYQSKMKALRACNYREEILALP